ADARRALHGQVRRACEEQRKLRIGYKDQEGKATERVIHPFALLRWETVWTLIAWCELRKDDRHFRLDRIAGVEVLDERFGDESAGAAKALRARLEAGTG
ncbi:MAG: WYL domain-containing protein, partial [Pseudomonadota bacterium]